MCDHYFLIAVLEIVICHRNPPNSMAHNHNTLSYLMLWWFRISCRAGQGGSSVWHGISRNFKVPLGSWWVLHCWSFTRMARRQRIAGTVHLSIHQYGKIMLNPHGGSRIWVRSSIPVKEAAWSFLSFLFARFHHLTVPSPPWWKRMEHRTLHLSGKNFKALQLCFKTTMPSLLDTSIKIFDLSTLLLSTQGFCGAYWLSYPISVPQSFITLCKCGRNQNQQHPACSGLTNRRMKVTGKYSFACLALDSPSLGNGTYLRYTLPLWVDVTWVGPWPRHGQLKYNDFSTPSSQVSQGLMCLHIPGLSRDFLQ